MKDRIYRIFSNHTSQATAISRRELELELMTTDRAARRIIEDARNMGIPIGILFQWQRLLAK